jgi:Kef-type K+ transport system membrane component KefB
MDLSITHRVLGVAYPFIFQVLIVLAAAVIAGEVFEQFRMPSVAGELLSGIVLGPTFFGIVYFSSDLQALSTIALFFIIFLIGLEMNTETLRKHAQAALLLAFTSFLLPLLLAFVLAAIVLPFGRTSDFVFALAIAVPSISIISVLVMQYEILEKESGQIILSTVVVADLVAFVLLAGTTSPIPSTVNVVTYTAIFIAAFVLVDWVLNTRPQKVREGLAKMGRMARREDLAYALLIVVGLAVASIFQAIGLSYIIGAYFAGLIVHDGLIGRKAFQEVSQALSKMNRAIFIPFFFGFAGLEANLSSSGYGLLPGLGVVVAASIIPAALLTYYGAKNVLRVSEPGGPRQIALTLGGRGAVGIVIASVALGNGVIDSTAYSLIVIGTLAVSLLVPLFLGRKGIVDRNIQD